MSFFSIRSDAHIVNHLQIDSIDWHKPSHFAEKPIYRNGNGLPVGATLYYTTQAFPVIAALFQKAGIALRCTTDLLEFSMAAIVSDLAKRHTDKKSPELSVQLVKSVFSCASAYAIFFAPKYFEMIEVARSIVMHTRDAFHALQETNGKVTKFTQAVLHLGADLVNVAILKKDRLELRCASHGLQLLAGIFDFKKQWDQTSYFGMAMQMGITGLRARSFAPLGKELYKTRLSA